ncbi:MAG: thermonuclease family protein [Comamonas sp.]
MLTALAICLIVGISDGDTLTARCGEPGSYEQIKIRLGGIDAPESRQPWGQRSKQNLSDLCFQVQAEITLKSKDRYGRTIADVRCGGLDAGQHQVATGMAWYYVKYGRGYEGFREIEQTARYSKLGLWRDSGPIAPWDWRKGARLQSN